MSHNDMSHNGSVIERLKNITYTNNIYENHCYNDVNVLLSY